MTNKTTNEETFEAYYIEQQLYKSYRDNKDFAADLNDIIKQIMAVRGGARF